MNTEFKQGWYLRGEMDEEHFVAHRLPELGLTGIHNPEKKFSPFPPDLIVEGLLSDLKAQSTPFFTAGRYGIDPQYAVTFNVKDERNYRESYPEVVVFFDVLWTKTDNPYGATVEPMHHTWCGTLDQVMDVVAECGGHKHTYLRRIDDTQGNAKDSWVLDVRKLLFLG